MTTDLQIPVALKQLEAGGAPFTIGGRTFGFAECRTIEHAQYLVACLRHLCQRTPLVGAPDLVYRDLVFAAYQAGVLIPLLAGLLREHGRDWSIDGAAESCALFARTTDANDHRTLFRAFAAGFERLAGHEGRIRELASQPLVDTRFRFSHTFSDEFSHKD